MNIFDFEKRLKNHSTNSRGRVDMDRLLSDLDIKTQPKSRIGYRYFFFTGLVLMGLGYFTFSNVFDDSSLNQANTFTVESETVKQTTAVEETTAIKPTKTIKKRKTTKEVEAMPSNIQNEETVLINQTLLSEEKTTITLNKITNPKSSSLNKTEINKLSPSFENTSYKSSIPQKAFSKKGIQGPIVPASLNSIKVEKAKTAESKIIADTKDNIIQTNLAQNIAIDRLNQSVGLLPTSAVSLLDLDDRISNKRGSTCPQFSERLWHIYVVPEVGYTFPMKTLTLNDEDFRFIFTERIAHESTIEGINASISLQFKNQITGLYVKPGVSYSRITERIDFVRRDIQFDTITTTIDGGATVEEIEEKELITRSLVHYQLHEFELPVALGYSLNINKIAIDIEAGIKFNFLQRASGQILSSERDFIDVGNDNVDLFKSSVGLGFFGGILFKKHLNSRTELYLAPRFSINTLSYSSNSNPITQRYNVFGLHAGLIYALH